MSQSIAAAKRRRAGIQSTDVNQVVNNPEVSQGPQVQQQKISIPMYLNKVTEKLKELENKIDQNENPAFQIQFETEEGIKSMLVTDYMQDMDKKFELLLDEVNNLKETVNKLQTFTLEVNQRLFNKVFTGDDLILDKNYIDTSVNTEDNLTKNEE
tara:strand:+ start:928 stop:1392 length:465 start_codon:yes stop_codon:yes gene_type:complete